MPDPAALVTNLIESKYISIHNTDKQPISDPVHSLGFNTYRK